LSISSPADGRDEASDPRLADAVAFFVIEKFGVENGYPSTITMQVRQVLSGHSAQVWKDYRSSEQDVFEADAKRLAGAFADRKMLDLQELAGWRRYEWRAT
jgi:hypothetical protein